MSQAAQADPGTRRPLVCARGECPRGPTDDPPDRLYPSGRTLTKEKPMGILPRKTAELLVFCQQHIGPWTANSAAIGLAPAQTVALGTATTGLASKVDDQAAAELAARTSVQETRTAADDLRGIAADCLRLIKAFAENQNKPDLVC